jgi:hypothetical protein
MIQELQEFRTCRSSVGKVMPLGDKDSWLVSTAKGKSLSHRHGGGPELHSVTPELLNSCNSLKSSNFSAKRYVSI